MDVVDQTKPTTQDPRQAQGYSGAYPAHSSCGIMQRQFLPTFSPHLGDDAFCNVRHPGSSFVQIIIVMHFATWPGDRSPHMVEVTTFYPKEGRGDAVGHDLAWM